MTEVEAFLSRLSTAAGGLIDNVVFETDITPRVVISQPLAKGAAPKNAAVEALLTRIRPRAVVNYTADSGLPPLVVAPYGTPTPLTEDESNLATVLLAAVGVLSLVLVWRGLFCHRCSVRRPFLGGVDDNSRVNRRVDGSHHRRTHKGRKA